MLFNKLWKTLLSGFHVSGTGSSSTVNLGMFFFFYQNRTHQLLSQLSLFFLSKFAIPLIDHFPSFCIHLDNEVFKCLGVLSQNLFFFFFLP